jgi:glycolate oxidase
MVSQLLQALKTTLGPEAVLHRPEELMLYEYDGSVEIARPTCVVFPRTTADVLAIVKLANQYQTPLIGRGAGTGLSGGALARKGGILTVFSRMNRILEIDIENHRATVQPGVVNSDLSTAVAHAGLHFAPDPSSQKACTIGGNVSENSGGPHTLAYGVTTNHVLSLEAILPTGELIRIGSPALDSPGYDLLGLFVGSEGTLALITEITVKLTRLPEAVKTLLAIFESLDDATETVVDITARGITPAACEMLDGWTLRAVEAYVHASIAPRYCCWKSTASTKRCCSTPKKSPTFAAPITPAKYAWPATPANATSSGKAARTLSAPSAASRPRITCRTA